MKGNRIPVYYIGRRYKIEARKVIEDFELSYNVGTAVTYLLRADRKHDSPIECIQKAINHFRYRNFDVNVNRFDRHNHAQKFSR